jgi:hypothetical protein
MVAHVLDKLPVLWRYMRQHLHSSHWSHDVLTSVSVPLFFCFCFLDCTTAREGGGRGGAVVGVVGCGLLGAVDQDWIGSAMLTGKVSMPAPHSFLDAGCRCTSERGRLPQTQTTKVSLIQRRRATTSSLRLLLLSSCSYFAYQSLSLSWHLIVWIITHLFLFFGRNTQTPQCRLGLVPALPRVSATGVVFPTCTCTRTRTRVLRISLF